MAGFTPEMRAKAAEVRRQKAEARRAFCQAQGIGESKVFAAPPGTFPESSVLDCHVGGVLVRDLPIEVQGRILYQQTDEGIAERNAGKVDSAARVTEGPLEKAIQARGDESLQPWEAPDPMQELVKKHIQSGMRPRFLSTRKTDKDGKRGWEVVVDPKTGEPVKLGTLILAQMPEQKASSRNAFYQAKSEEDLREIFDEYAEKQERMIRDAGARGVGVLRPGDLLKDERGSGTHAIGLHSVRGNEKEL